jgi:hypothetical protein
MIQNWDFNGYTVTIQMADGHYFSYDPETFVLRLRGNHTGQLSPRNFIIQGNENDKPCNCRFGQAMSVDSAWVTIKNMGFSNNLIVYNDSIIYLNGHAEFRGYGAVTAYGPFSVVRMPDYMWVSGQYPNTPESYAIAYHSHLAGGGSEENGTMIHLFNTPPFYDYPLALRRNAVATFSETYFLGSCDGVRLRITGNSSIETNSGEFSLAGSQPIDNDGTGSVI